MAMAMLKNPDKPLLCIWVVSDADQDYQHRFVWKKKTGISFWFLTAVPRSTKRVYGTIPVRFSWPGHETPEAKYRIMSPILRFRGCHLHCCILRNTRPINRPIKRDAQSMHVLRHVCVHVAKGSGTHSSGPQTYRQLCCMRNACSEWSCHGTRGRYENILVKFVIFEHNRTSERKKWGLEIANGDLVL